jgi:hypothetical protein
MLAKCASHFPKTLFRERSSCRTRDFTSNRAERLGKCGVRKILRSLSRLSNFVSDDLKRQTPEGSKSHSMYTYVCTYAMYHVSCIMYVVGKSVTRHSLVSFYQILPSFQGRSPPGRSIPLCPERLEDDGTLHVVCSCKINLVQKTLFWLDGGDGTQEGNGEADEGEMFLCQIAF